MKEGPISRFQAAIVTGVTMVVMILGAAGNPNLQQRQCGAGDWRHNGDGVTDAAVCRPTDGTWYLRNITNVPLVCARRHPVQADYNGDGVPDLAVWRPSNGTWFIRSVATLAWGAPRDIPEPGD
jgi:hypothetical protein